MHTINQFYVKYNIFILIITTINEWNLTYYSARANSDRHIMLFIIYNSEPHPESR